MKHENKDLKMVYSESLNEMVVKGFTRVKVTFYKDNRPYKISAQHYTWNDEDCVYYNDDVDDDYFMKIPEKIFKPSWIQREINGSTNAIFYKKDRC